MCRLRRARSDRGHERANASHLADVIHLEHFHRQRAATGALVHQPPEGLTVGKCELERDLDALVLAQRSRMVDDGGSGDDQRRESRIAVPPRGPRP